VLFELVRAALLIAFSIIAFGVTIEGNVLTMVLILTVYITICAALGMLISSLVRTEQQFMAVAMLFSLPTMFLSGAFFPVQAMPGFMQAIARFLPVTYAGDALRTIMVKGLPFSYTLYPLGILMVFLIIIIGILMKVFKRDVE
jgi:ABC-2 type transport system permease protein